MSVSIKSAREIELMREAGRILAITHEEMRKAIKLFVIFLAKSRKMKKYLILLKS